MRDLDGLKNEVRALREELQRQRRRSHAVLAIAALIGGMAVLVGAKEPTSVLRADRIEVGDGTPGIVLTEGDGGPTITLSTADGRTTRLSMAGLEVTTRAGEPTQAPTLDDPGLGEAPPPEGVQVVVQVAPDDYVTHLEVACTSGHRQRARFTEGRAVMTLPPEERECVGTIGGGTTMTRFALRPGDHLECERYRKGAGLTCRHQSPPGPQATEPR